MIDDILFDFDLNMPRVIIGANVAILDNVKKIVLLRDGNIVVDTGNRFVSVVGNNLLISLLDGQRMQIKGEFTGLEFYKGESRK